MRRKNILPAQFTGRAVAASVAVVTGAVLVLTAAAAETATQAQRAKHSVNGGALGKKW